MAGKLESLTKLLKQHDVGVLNGAAMAHGLLTNDDPDVVNARMVHPRPAYQVAVARRLYQFCQEKDVPMLAVVFQFCMRQEMIDCTLTGAKNIAEIDANFTAATTPLPESIWPELAALDLNAMWLRGEQQAQ